MQQVYKLVDERHDEIVTFDMDSSDAWVQVATDSNDGLPVNFAYRSTEPLEQRLESHGINVPPDRTIEYCAPTRAATFAAPDRQVEFVVNFVDQLFARLLGCGPDVVIRGTIE